MRTTPTPPNASRQQRATLDRLTREHGTGRIVVREGASQTLRVLLVDARGGCSVELTITRGGFLQ